MAIQEAILAANSTDNDDRLVEIPAYTFSSLPIRSDNIDNITMQIDGKVLVSKDYKSFPNRDERNIEDFLAFYDSNDLVFEGTGVIDGQGFMWWVREFISKNIYGRPLLVQLHECHNVEWTGIKLMNGPYYHLNAHVHGAWFHDFVIEVDVLS
jgi:hypothetical protein